METIEEWILNQLNANGLFPEQAAHVLAKVKPAFEKTDESMKTRWNDNITDYSEDIKWLWWKQIKLITKHWLTKNAPGHWARPMFD